MHYDKGKCQCDKSETATQKPAKQNPADTEPATQKPVDTEPDTQKPANFRADGPSQTIVDCPTRRGPKEMAPVVTCSTVVVSGGKKAKVNGVYELEKSVKAEWAPEKPVYKHVEQAVDRFIFWNAHGIGWSIGDKEGLTNGENWYFSECPYFFFYHKWYSSQISQMMSKWEKAI